MSGAAGSSVKERSRTRRFAALRLMSCLAVVPIGLGPTVVAFADEPPSSTTTTIVTTPTTEPTPTADPVPSTAPAESVPSTTIAPAPPTTTAPVTAPPSTNAPTSSDPSTTVDTTPTGDDDPVATSTTVPSEPATATTSTVDSSAPTTDITSTTTPADSASTTSAPDTSVPVTTSDAPSTTLDTAPSVDPTTTTASTTSTSTTSTVAPPLLAAAPPALAPPNTNWTLGLRYLGGTTYTGTFDLYLRAQFGGTTVELTDGQVSPPLARRTGVDEYVRVEMGSSYVAAFPYTWECVGDVSGPQVGTTQQFTPVVDDMDSTMDCVFVIDNTDPPVVDIVSEVLGDDTGTVSFDYSVDYASFDRVHVTSFGGGAGTTGSAAGLAGFSLQTTAVGAAGNPPNVQTTARCVDAGGGSVSTGYSESVSTPRDHMVPGARITCTFTHVVPSTLTIIEDVVPDTPAAPAADYEISRFRTVENLLEWQLSDGQTQLHTLRPDYSGNATVTRDEVPGWDLDRVDCVEDVGGSMVPYTDYSVTLGSTSGRASFPSPPPGTDIVCTFVSVPAGPPSVHVAVEPNVIDEAAYADFVVEVRDAGGVLLQTITAPPGGWAQTEPLPSDGSFTATITNPQGLDATWTCDGAATTGPTVSFPTILGETARCTLALVEPIPTGTATLTLRKNEDPDYFYFQNYSVEVKNGDYLIGSGTIAEDEPGIVFSGLAGQTLTIIETSRNSAYELASVVCTNVVSTSPITRIAYIDEPEDGNLIREGTFAIDFVDGVDIDCLLTNSPSTASSILRIETVTEPAGSSQQFDYSISPAGLVPVAPTFSQGDGDEASREVAGGNFFTVTQSPVADFFTEAACFPTSAYGFHYEQLDPGIYVENDVDYTCEFINTFAPASLTVGVDVEPDDATVETGVSVDRDGSYVATDSPTILGDGSVVASTLVNGTYSISIEYPYAQHVTSVVGASCTEGATTVVSVGGVPTTRVTTITAEIVGGVDASCMATLELAPQIATVTVDTDVPYGLTPTAGYVVTPAANVIAGAAAFDHVGVDSSAFDFDIGPALTITQTAPDGFVASVDCVDALSGGVATGTTSVTFTPADADDITCTFTLVPESPTLTIRTVTVPATATGTPAFDYAITPDGGFSGASSPFDQPHDGETVFVFDPAAVFDPADFFGISPYAGPDVPTITQDSLAGYATSVGCYDADLATEPASYVDTLVATPVLAPGQNVVCIFENRLDAPGAHNVTIDAIVSTGLVDVADRFSFQTALAGPGLRGPVATGTPQSVSLSNGGSTSVSIDAGTAITIDATDVLAGANGFEYSIDCGVYFEANSPVTLTPGGDVDCTVTFEARTVTVNKFVDPFVGGFDAFAIDVDPALDPSSTFWLEHGEQEIVVVALAGAPELTELDFGSYEPSIECTQIGFGGPVSPSTGPFGGDSVQLPADRMSYECDVVNTVSLVPSYEITLESELDFGAVAIPSDFPGIDVVFDGDLADDAGGPIPQFGPTDLIGRRSSLAPVLGAPVANLLDTVTVAPNGTVSVLVVDGGDVTIRPAAGSERFATSITCPGGTVDADGSVTLADVGAAETCTMRNSAGNVTLTHTVTGPATATSWPFSISNVVAGPSAVSLGNGGSVTVAVGVDSSTSMTQTDALGATSVASSCGAVSLTSLTGYRSLIDSMIDNSEIVTVGGGQSVTCSFVTEYAVSAPPTTVPPTTAPPATVPPTTTVPTSPGPTVPTPSTTDVTSGPTPDATTTTAPPTPQVPFAPPGVTPPTNGTPSTTVITTVPTPDEPEAPTTAPPVDDDPAPTTVPDDDPGDVITDEPDVVITDDPGTPDVFVDIGDPIPVDIDCDGTTTIFVNGVEQDRVDQIEPSALGLGDHVIEVRCDDETITEVRAVVFEQDEGSPAGSNMTVIVMFVVMAVGAFVFAPSAAGRKRLAL